MSDLADVGTFSSDRTCRHEGKRHILIRGSADAYRRSLFSSSQQSGKGVAPTLTTGLYLSTLVEQPFREKLHVSPQVAEPRVSQHAVSIFFSFDVSDA